MPVNAQPVDRAVVFIDGNNWYHALRESGVPAPGRLSYARISQKLLGPRLWIRTHYYIGALKQNWNRHDYARQRAFLSRLRNDDPRVSVHLGRLEQRTVTNPLAERLLDLLDRQALSLPNRTARRLRTLALQYTGVTVLKEKAVDIMLARDLLESAMLDTFDSAYLLSSDGDYTPVVQSVRRRGKNVYVASPGYSSALQRASTSFIRLDSQWFVDCYR